MNRLLSSFFYLAVIGTVVASVSRPRSVSKSMASMYRPDVPFKCLDGSKQIPFEYINDDYCDCEDGSDEPGTSACPLGKFHCTNAGHIPVHILSSRVNDGICDCCDGTDEWSGNIDCVNNCKELGQKLMEEKNRIRKLQEDGYQIRLAYAEQGKKAREEKQDELKRLEAEKEQLDVVKMEMEEKKTAAEMPEQEAKDRHQKAWEAIKEQRQAEEDEQNCKAAFLDLDVNNNQRVCVAEMQKHLEFDIDSNGEVGEDEAKEYLEEKEEADFDHFSKVVWPHIKQVYQKKSDTGDSKGDVQDTPPTEPKAPGGTVDDGYVDDEDDEEDDDDDDIDDDEIERNDEGGDPGAAKKEEEEKMPEYDEETQKLIEAADEARRQLSEAESKLREVDGQINQINSYLSHDYGPDEEFSALKGNCFEYTDREYTYKLCPFERASQRPKNGGAETTLGNWGHWEGPANDKYSTMKYDRGQNCWNGPDRSVKVNLVCGVDNSVTNAFEPSRCEYEFDFSTPSRCHKPREEPVDIHDEL